MKIYTISVDSKDYDTYNAHVIVANNIREVITLAKEISADEGKKIWEKGEIEEEGVYTGKEKNPFILLSDFSAG